MHVICGLIVALSSVVNLCFAVVIIPRTSSLTCKEIQIPVSASAENILLPLSLTLASASQLTNVTSYETSLQASTYTIAARFCEPTRNVTSRRNTLQVLVHGATYTKDYWSGLAPPGTDSRQDPYSWILYAASQGYPTLSIDRLCNGDSSHASGLLECQVPMQTNILSQIIHSARGGTLPPTSRSFSSIIVACHSYGSLVCNALSASDPSAADTLVLTGFSAALLNGLPGIGTWPLFLPTSLPDPSYLKATQSSGAEYLFYYDTYSEATHKYDFANRGTVTVGEIATVLFGQVSAPTYKGAVFLMNGNDDAVFCQLTAVSPLLRQRGNCKAGRFADGVRGLYPAARAFGHWEAKDTGHCVNLHFTAQDSFARAHGWLAEVGF